MIQIIYVFEQIFLRKFCLLSVSVSNYVHHSVKEKEDSHPIGNIDKFTTYIVRLIKK